MEVHGQVILSFFFGFCCFVSFPPSSFRTFDIFGNLFSGVLKFWTCSIEDTNERYIESFTQRRSANFFSYLSIIQSVSRKLWSEAAWFRFSTHLYFAIASIYWISICICYLLKHLSIHVISLCPFKGTEQRSFRNTLKTNIYLFFHSRLAFDQNFCFNYGYQCNNQIVWCAINRIKEHKQSKFKRK